MNWRMCSKKPTLSPRDTPGEIEKNITDIRREQRQFQREEETKMEKVCEALQYFQNVSFPTK